MTTASNQLMQPIHATNSCNQFMQPTDGCRSRSLNARGQQARTKSAMASQEGRSGASTLTGLATPTSASLAAGNANSRPNRVHPERCLQTLRRGRVCLVAADFRIQKGPLGLNFHLPTSIVFQLLGEVPRIFSQVSSTLTRCVREHRAGPSKP